MPHGQPGIGQVPPHNPHALRLFPVRMLMPHQPFFAQPLVQDEDAEWRERDAAVAEGSQEPPDDMTCWP